MSNRRIPPPPVRRPRATEEDYSLMDAMGLRVMCHQPGNEAGWALPRDIIGRDGKTVILWRPAGQGPVAYDVDGWHPWHDGMSGGCNTHLSNALAWVERAREVRAGTAEDFRGR
jgi:hypothetical protein